MTLHGKRYETPPVTAPPCQPISALRAAFGGCAPKRACGRSLKEGAGGAAYSVGAVHWAALMGVIREQRLGRRSAPPLRAGGQ